MMERAYIKDADAIVHAVADGELELATQLLRSGADVNVQDERGRTALHAAAEEGYIFAVQMLLAAGAKPDEPDADGNTPLDYAVFRKHGDIAQALIAAGAVLREGKSPAQLLDDATYEAFEHADAVKRFVAMIEEGKQTRESQS